MRVLPSIQKLNISKSMLLATALAMIDATSLDHEARLCLRDTAAIPSMKSMLMALMFSTPYASTEA